MSIAGNRLRGLTPGSMLRLYFIAVTFTALVAVGCVLFTTNRVDDYHSLATQEADAVSLASESRAALRSPVTVLFLTFHTFLLSDAADELPAALRTQLYALAQNQTVGSLTPQANLPVPNIRMDISERNALDLQAGIMQVDFATDRFLASADSGVDVSAVARAQAEMSQNFTASMNTKQASDFRILFGSLLALDAALAEARDAYAAKLDQTQASLASVTQIARYAVIGAVVFLLATMLVGAAYVSRMIQRAFQSGESERENLRETTATLQYRNEQLNALYNVFSDITDSLSTGHVISATLRETLTLMRARVVSVRLIRDGKLVPVGTLTASGRPLPPIPVLAIGEGIGGRVVKRGRGERIDEGAQAKLYRNYDPEDPEGPLESGIVMPLIVAAKVIGTLSCWSPELRAFHEEDERVLEMMASQVATAIVAAETQETLERHAFSDSLTSLPNRRQLSQDMDDFATWLAEGRSAVVAMVDIDHFKRLNDDHGHTIGDLTLQKVASILRRSIRESDRIYRYGGEEFLIIFPDASEAEGMVLTQALLKAVAETNLAGDGLGRVGQVTVSAGLATMPAHGSEITDLIGLADRAMYQAKQGGRNRIAIWQDQPARPHEKAA